MAGRAISHVFIGLRFDCNIVSAALVFVHSRMFGHILKCGL